MCCIMGVEYVDSSNSRLLPKPSNYPKQFALVMRAISENKIKSA